MSAPVADGLSASPAPGSAAPAASGDGHQVVAPASRPGWRGSWPASRGPAPAPPPPALPRASGRRPRLLYLIDSMLLLAEARRYTTTGSWWRAMASAGRGERRTLLRMKDGCIEKYDLDNQHAAARPGPARQHEGSLRARWPWTRVCSRQRRVCLHAQARPVVPRAPYTCCAPDRARTPLAGRPARLAGAGGRKGEAHYARPRTDSPDKRCGSLSARITCCLASR